MINRTTINEGAPLIRQIVHPATEDVLCGISIPVNINTSMPVRLKLFPISSLILEQSSLPRSLRAPDLGQVLSKKPWVLVFRGLSRH